MEGRKEAEEVMEGEMEVEREEKRNLCCLFQYSQHFHAPHQS